MSADPIEVTGNVIDLMEALRESLNRKPGEPAPGVYPGMPMAEYLALPCVSASALLQIQRSPAHARAYVDPVDTISNEDSAATIVGTAIHTALIEPDLFHSQYVRGPAGNWSLKAPKDQKAALQAEFPDALILKPYKYDAILAARDALLAHPIVSEVVAAAHERELTIIWRDNETRLLCKARPDLLCWGDTVVDLKSTEDASRAGFARAIARFGYDQKAAFYLDGMGSDYQQFVFIAAEVREPYACAVYQIEPADIEAARRENRRALRIWAECNANNEWPGYDSAITWISAPEWRQAQLRELGNAVV